MKLNLTKRILFISMLISNINTFAQSSNALSFDGVNDLVFVPSASALISGSDAISVTCWVYPTNPSPNTTSYDGILGFRNNVDADFYILHFTANSVEARFRNSSGQAFDIIGGGILLNTWQHLAFTYDGSMLRYYHNGLLLDSIAATGEITLNNESFYMGTTPYQGSQFNLAGRLDEVTLWNKTLLSSDLTCLLSGDADTSEINLLLYYKFDQGIPSGNNTAITALTDSKLNINGILSGLSLTGSTSNFIANTTGSNSNVSASICLGDTFIFGSQVLTNSGIYFNTFTSSAGCDSAVMLTLTVTNVNAAITQNGSTLVATPSFATYQWINCTTGLPIPNATNVSYNTQNINGLYAVVVTNNGCSDTSACFAITTGLGDMPLTGIVSIYPSPVTDLLNIRLAMPITHASYKIYDFSGKEVLRNSINSNTTQVDIRNLKSGYYTLQLLSDEGIVQKTFVKQ